MTAVESRPMLDAAAVASGPATLALTRRAIVRFIRLPQVVAPTVIMPAFFIIAFTGSFDGVSRVEGYPTDNITNWVAAFAIVQSCAFAGIGGAAVLATDLETGFIDRVRVSPIRREAFLLAPLGQAATRALVPTTIVLIISAFKGASMPGGFLGLALVYVGGIGSAVVLGTVGLVVVLIIKSVRGMAIVQILAFLVLFPSTGQVPIALMDGWLAQMARINPATDVLAMTRQGFLGDVTWSATWPGLLVLGIGVAVFGSIARAQLSRLDG